MNTKTSTPNARTTRTRSTKEIAMNTKTDAPTKSLSPYVRLLEEFRPELDAAARGPLLPVNVDIPTAIHHARSALPVLELLRPQIARYDGIVDLKKYDRVADYARLLQYTHGCYLATVEAPDTVTPTYEETVRARDYLLAFCPGLVAAKLLPQSLIDQVRPGTGFQDAITDVTTLTSALRAIWSQIEGKTLITAAHLDEADALAEKLAEGVAMRDSLVASISKRATDRQLAFTLFANAYAEARATVIFLRRNEEDGETLVPSIYTKAPSARRSEEPAEPTPAPAPSPIEAAKPVAPAKPEAPAKPAAPVQPDEELPLNQSSPFAFPVKA